MSNEKMRAKIDIIANSPQELEQMLQEIADRISEGSIGGTDATPEGGSYKFEAQIPDGWTAGASYRFQAVNADRW